MLRTLFVLFVLFHVITAQGQSCMCESDNSLADVVSCEPIRFDNRAVLYWSFDCDSSWLTFKSPMGQKEIIFLLGNGLQYLTGRLGYIYLTEYKNAFLIQNNVISGCCSPPEFFLFDKNTGELRKNLGRVVFYSEDRNTPIIVSVTNSNYDTSAIAEDYASLSIYNIDQNKTFYFKLPKNEIRNALNENEMTYPEYLFDTPVLDNGKVTLTYNKRSRKYSARESVRKISIDLRKYN